MSLDALEAAQALLEAGHTRSSISRAYYAAYCGLAEELSRRRVRFARGWNNPAHEQLPELIRNGLTLPVDVRRRMNRAMRRLRTSRENADYRPGVTVDRSDAVAAIHDATSILEALEITGG
jgi:uncharacterized protein (UPF0332 family)